MLFLASMGETRLSHDIFLNSHLGLPYLFEVRSQRFEVAASKFNIDHHLTSVTSKGPSENFKKKSWDNPVSPMDAKNSIGFLYYFLGVSLDF